MILSAFVDEKKPSHSLSLWPPCSLVSFICAELHITLRLVRGGQRAAHCSVGATANPDSPCARQRPGFVGRGEETGFPIEQRD